MGNPALARNDDEGRRFYTWKDEAYWSVTTIIAGGVPKFLHAHYAKMAAELAYESILERGPYSRATAVINRCAARARAYLIERQAAGELTSLKVAKMTTRELALRWLKGAAERHRDAAAARGSDVHSEAEAHVLELAKATSADLAAQQPVRTWPEHLAGYEQSFRAFLADWQPEYLAAEATVFNRPQAYAGTLDAIARLRAGDLMRAVQRVGDEIPTWLARHSPHDRVTGLGDYKAGNAVYAEVGMQDAAYARAEFIGLPDGVTEAPLPAVEFGFVLHLTPTGYHLHLVDIGDEVYDAFRFAREVFRFRQDIARRVIGRDLAPVRTKAAA